MIVGGGKPPDVARSKDLEIEAELLSSHHGLLTTY
jgi:hypothetical protein